MTSIVHIPEIINVLYAGDRQTVVFRSAPGIGKTEQVRATVAQLSEKYGTEFGFVEEHLASRSEVDLRGYLIPNGTDSFYTKPDFWSTITAHERGILFLDELFQCSVEMQKVIAPLLLDRRIGDHVLPDGWMVVGATNGVEHNSGVTAPPLQHVVNRVSLVDLDPPTPEAVANFYAGKDLPPEVIAMVLKAPGTVLGTSPATRGSAYCTPRSLFQAGRVLRQYPNAGEALESTAGRALVEGFIGRPATEELRAICRLANTLPSMEDIVSNPTGTPIPDTVDKQWLVTSMLGARATAEQAVPAFDYVSRMPANVAFVALWAWWTRGLNCASANIAKWCVENDPLLNAVMRGKK